MKNNNKTHKMGFTLIELIIIAAIISVLATMLFPVFAKQSENAKKETCADNLQKIGLAFKMYAQDYDDRYPLAIFGTEPNPVDKAHPKHVHTRTKDDGWCEGLPCDQFRISDGLTAGQMWSWMDLLYPYTKSVQVFACPSQDTNNGSSHFLNSPGYGYNVYISNLRSPALNNQIPVKTSSLQYPSTTILSTDCPRIFGVFLKTTDPFNPKAHAYDSPHDNGFNVLFADGHVEWQNKDHPIGSGKKADINKWWKGLE